MGKLREKTKLSEQSLAVAKALFDLGGIVSPGFVRVCFEEGSRTDIMGRPEMS